MTSQRRAKGIFHLAIHTHARIAGSPPPLATGQSSDWQSTPTRELRETLVNKLARQTDWQSTPTRELRVYHYGYIYRLPRLAIHTHARIAGTRVIAEGVHDMLAIHTHARIAGKYVGDTVLYATLAIHTHARIAGNFPPPVETR